MSDAYSFFKFSRIDKYLVKSIVDSELWCASPETLNDPFDCQIDLRKSFANAEARATSPRKEQLLAVLNDTDLLEKWTWKLKSAGVCAFSMSSDNSLMWSHYAENHKGVCLLYEFSESFFSGATDRIIGVSKATYINNFFTEWVETTPSIEDSENFIFELTKIYLTVKSELWAYEDEVRILSFSEGPLALPQGCLKQVCFGLQTPKADIELVMSLTSKFAGVDVFYQMERGPNDFGIQMRKL